MNEQQVVDYGSSFYEFLFYSSISFKPSIWNKAVLYFFFNHVLTFLFILEQENLCFVFYLGSFISQLITEKEHFPELLLENKFVCA